MAARRLSSNSNTAALPRKVIRHSKTMVHRLHSRVMAMVHLRARSHLSTTTGNRLRRHSNMDTTMDRLHSSMAAMARLHHRELLSSNLHDPACRPSIATNGHMETTMHLRHHPRAHNSSATARQMAIRSNIQLVMAAEKRSSLASTTSANEDSSAVASTT